MFESLEQRILLANVLYIYDVAALEGNAGQTEFRFHVTLTRTDQNPVTVKYSTADGTATAADNDYVPIDALPPQTLDFGTTGTDAYISVFVKGDTKLEGDNVTGEIFYVNLTSPVNAVVTGPGARWQAKGNILNDDGPSVSIAGPAQAVPEGSSGTTPAPFTVTLSDAYYNAVTVQYYTVDGTAKANADYEPIAQNPPQTLTFAAGETSKTITVNIIGNTVDEDNRSFSVKIANPVNATIATNQAEATIQDDDTCSISISPTTLSAAEGNSGTTDAVFSINLSCLSTKTVSVTASTAAGTATSGVDFTAKSQALSIPAGQASAEFRVSITGDTTYEANETFYVNLSAPANGVIQTGQSTCTITNDDAMPVASIVASMGTAEGNTGTNNLLFRVTLSQASGVGVTVNYATRNDTATAPSDFIALDSVGGGDQPLYFGPGVTYLDITVKIKVEYLWEPDETFYVDLVSATGATIDPGNKTSVGTIQNDDKPNLSIGNATALTEGNSGQQKAEFQVTLSPASAEVVTVKYATQDNQAKAGEDYVAISPAQTLTFNPGETTKTIEVWVNGDTIYENTETFYVNLSAAVNGTIIFGGRGVGTINDDDSPPTLTIADAQLTEGNSGTSSGNFTLTLSVPTERSLTIQYYTQDGTAVAPIDYTAIALSTFTVPMNVTTAAIPVPIVGNTLDQDNRSFSLTILNALGGTIPGGQMTVTGTIVDDDDPPLINIEPTKALDEGASGLTEVTFYISLSEVSGKVVTVEVYSLDGTATSASGDYAAMTPQTITFWQGEALHSVSVYVNGDTLYEIDETFYVKLRNAGNGTIAGDTGTVTILNDDPPPSVSIDASHSIQEGNSGTSLITFNVTLSQSTGAATTVDWRTRDGTAVAGSDYMADSGTANISAGQTTTTISVRVIGDIRNEDNKTFYIDLSNPTPSNIEIGQGEGAATILDNDPPPSLSISNAPPVTEGNSGTTTATFTVTLTPASGKEVTVQWATADGTAKSGLDYLAGASSLTFAPGETARTIAVSVGGDTTDEYNETFFVNLSTPANATIAAGQGTGTITDDDDPPTISIGDAQATEGNSGTTDMVFTVDLSAASEKPITVHWATADNNAKAGSDYEANSGDLTFDAGVTSRTVTVKVKGDVLHEVNETFFVDLSNLVNVVAGKTHAVGTILDDDPIPTVSIGPSTVAKNEGNSGTVRFDFTVSLSVPSGTVGTVDFTTQDGTALAGSDYAANSGTLTFQPGETSKNVPVYVNGNTTQENDETFFVNLSNAANADMGAAQAQGTVLNDDTPSLTITDVTLTESNAGQKSFDFTVTLSLASDIPVTVDYSVIPGTATAGTDYGLVAPGTLTFEPGQTTKTISVPVNGDLTPEEDETFTVQLANPVTATFTKSQGNGLIVNDDNWPPIITVGGAAPTFVENGAAVIIDASAVVTDRDSPNFGTGFLAVTLTAGATADDRLAIRSQGTGAGQIGVSGSNVTYGGIVIGTFTGGSGSTPLMVTFNANATIEAVQALARKITFSNVSDAPSEAARTVQFVVNDGDDKSSDPSSKTVNVQAVNDAPVNTVPGAQTTPEDTTRVFSAANGNAITVADIDVGTGTEQITLTATHGTLTLGSTANLTVTGDGTGTVTLTGAIADLNAGMNGLVFQPAADYNGPASIQIVANDLGNTGTPGAQSDTDTVAVTVTPVNDKPAATPGSATTNEHAPKVITLAGTDVETPVSQLIFSIVTGPTHGTLGAVVGNQVTYTPTGDYNGPDSFTFKVTDTGDPAGVGTSPALASDPATMDITVQPVNDKPVATPQAVQVNEDGSVTVTLAGTDVETPADQLVFQIATQPQHGQLGTLTGNQVTYTPDPNYNNGNGPDSFTFTATDSGDPAGSHQNPSDLVSNPATVGLTVLAVNDVPSFTKGADQVANEDAATVTVSNWATGILAGPPDEAGQALTFNLTADDPTLFEVQPSVAANGTLTFKPALNQTGTATVTATLSDSGGTALGGVDTSAPQTFKIWVNPVNDQPVATPQTVDLNGAAFIDIVLAGTDVETAPQALVFNVVTLPQHGALTPMGGATYRYTPISTYIGPDSFTFTATDSGDPAGSHGNPSDLVSDPGTVDLRMGEQRFFAKDTVAKFTDSNGSSVTVTLTGPGTMNLWFGTHDPKCDLGRLILDNTTAKSSLSITVTPDAKAAVKYKTTTIGTIDAQGGSLGSIAAGAVSMTGDLLLGGGTLGKATFDDMKGGGKIEIGGTPAAKTGATLVFDQVQDTTVTSGMPIASLTAKEWLDTGGDVESISAPSLGTLLIAGDAARTILGSFGAALTLTGAGVAPTAKALGAATVKGNVAPVIWDVTGVVGTVTLSGVVGAAGQPWTLIHATTLSTLALGDAVDAAVTVDGDITTLKAIRWQAGSIQAKSLASLAITGAKATATAAAIPGDFGAALTLTGTTSTKAGATTLGTAAIVGALAPSTWDVMGLVGKVTISGVVGAAAQPWELKNATGLASLTAGDVVDAALTVDGDIGALKAIRWQAGPIQAKSLASLAITGDFGAALTLTGTTSTKAGATTLGATSIAGDVPAGTWDVTGRTGALTLSGLVGAAGQPWELKNATAVASLTAGDVVDAALTVDGDIGAVKAKRWQAGSIRAKTVASIVTTGVADTKTTVGYTGDFIADLFLTDATRKTLGTLTIAGWLVTNLTSAGSLGTLTVGGLRDATITVGAAGTASGIAGLTVKGGLKNQTFAFMNSNVMAWGDMGTVAVTSVETSNAGHTPFGIKALSIKAYTRDKVAHKPPAGSKIVDADTDYTAELI